jgi:hypothetical protein
MAVATVAGAVVARINSDFDRVAAESFAHVSLPEFAGERHPSRSEMTNVLSKSGACSHHGLDAKFDVNPFWRVYARKVYTRTYVLGVKPGGDAPPRCNRLLGTALQSPLAQKQMMVR